MIDKGSAIPLYSQVAREIRKDIFSGKYKNSASLGTQNEIGKRYDVSLITVRKALQILEKEGLVDIQQGKGTYVRRDTLVDNLENLTGISNMMAHYEIATEILVPELAPITTPSWLPEDVKREIGERCLYICRVVIVGDRPRAVVEMYLPEQYIDCFSAEAVKKATVYSIYQNELGIELGKGKQVISADAARGKVAKWLQVPEGDPVLLIRRKAYDAKGDLIEYMHLSYAKEAYSFEVELELSKG